MTGLTTTVFQFISLTLDAHLLTTCALSASSLWLKHIGVLDWTSPERGIAFELTTVNWSTRAERHVVSPPALHNDYLSVLLF